MSKLNIGVGDEFPLDESSTETGRPGCKDEYRAMRRALHGLRHGHRRHWHHHHQLDEEELMHLKLLAASSFKCMSSSSSSSW